MERGTPTYGLVYISIYIRFAKQHPFVLAYVNNWISWPSYERPKGGTARALGFLIRPMPTAITAVASPWQPNSKLACMHTAARIRPSAAAQCARSTSPPPAQAATAGYCFFLNFVTYLTFISLIFVIHKNNL
jgi:hypothetical protein